MLTYRLTSRKVLPHFTMNLSEWYFPDRITSVHCAITCVDPSRGVSAASHSRFVPSESVKQSWFGDINPSWTAAVPKPCWSRAQPEGHSALLAVPGLTSAPRRASSSPRGCWGLHQGNAAVWALTCSSFGCYGNCLFPGNRCQNKNSFVLNFLSYLQTL